MTYRNLLHLIFFIALGFWGWDRAMSHDGLVHFIDRHPDAWQADRALFFVGSFHELFNRDQKALEIYQRVLENYPESPAAEGAQYGAASCLERLRRWREAIVEYQKYLEKYPQGRFSNSVNNNLQILRSR
ncbi:MAG TPA: tetratricopeptide repeat protein [Elusimicrobiota bacterium]|nr:tetratricopeptide repeat protein [Elusimicrobiota bacterium]HMZ27762.1 tetratricopeptide repeat protein [Elusimicrobiota bacterium]HNA60302.1 tetratricopeptide repeat protein [Elusimicrobiota bacterium]HNF59633.1 tetratricopeptide repeat protein [Elusimicrobiota bacterium]